MRRNDYKLIQYLADGKVELYNLREAPKESKNLAKAMPEMTDQLLTQLSQWR